MLRFVLFVSLFVSKHLIDTKHSVPMKMLTDLIDLTISEKLECMVLCTGEISLTDGQNFNKYT